MRTYALLLLAGLGAIGIACTSSTASTAAGASANDGGVGGSTNPSTGNGIDGGSITSTAEPLNATTFVYVRSVDRDHDELIAHDLATGAERTVTNLQAAGETVFHSVAGFSISQDRRSIAVATNYGPETADQFTVSKRIFRLGVDGQGFVRLTPPWKNNGSGFYYIDVRDPVFSKDGATVYYTYGESNAGGTRTWSVSAAGGSLPTLIDSPAACSDVGQASVSPSDGTLVLNQSTCANDADEGLFAYPAGGAPALVLAAAGTSYNSPVGWAPDGSGFLIPSQDANSVGSLLLFDAMTKEAPVTIVQGTRDVTEVRSAAFAPDGKIVYCVRTSAGDNLHVIDTTVTPGTDTPITTDGKSCTPRF